MTAEVLLHERLTGVEVCALPPDHPQHSYFAVTVELVNGGDRWAVRDERSYSLNATTGRFDHDWHDPGDEARWQAEHRFTYDRAMELAREIAPTMTRNGYTIDDVRAWHPRATADMEAT